MTKKEFEEYLNKKSAGGGSLKSMTAVEMTYPLTKVNIRSNIRGNFGTLLRRHNPTEFNKRYKKSKLSQIKTKRKVLYPKKSGRVNKRKSRKFVKEHVEHVYDPYHSNIKLAPGITKMLDEYEKLRAKGLTHREASDKLEKKMF